MMVDRAAASVSDEILFGILFSYRHDQFTRHTDSIYIYVGSVMFDFLRTIEVNIEETKSWWLTLNL